MGTRDLVSLQIQKYLDKNTIKHPTALLHFERKLNAFEQGILFLCVHIVAKTDKGEDGFYYLNKSLVRAVMKQEGNQDYSKIDQAVKTLTQTTLKFNFLGEDRTFDDYEAPLIIGKASSKKRGVVAFEVHPRIEGVIKDPKVFSRLNIYFITALYDTARGYSFYALFKDHLDRTKEQVVTFEYWALRAYLGIEETAYPTFKAFKQWVLKPLLAAVNQRTDLKIDYEPLKTGRSLSHLKFTITPQAWQLPLFEREQVEKMINELELATNSTAILQTIETKTQMPSQHHKVEGGEDLQAKTVLIEQCLKIGVTFKTVERAISKHGLRGVIETLDLTLVRFAKMDASGEVYNPKNYLASMLNEGAGVKTETERKQDQIRYEKSEKMRQETSLIQDHFERALELKYWQAIFNKKLKEDNKDLRKALAQAEDQTVLKQEFLVLIKDGAAKADFIKKGWESLVCWKQMQAFGLQKLKRSFLTEEEFFNRLDFDFFAGSKSLDQVDKSTIYRHKLDEASRKLANVQSPNFKKITQEIFA